MIVHAQDSTVVWTSGRIIGWDDFLGSSKDSSKYDAEVFAEVCYKYEFSKTHPPKFEAFAIFNRNTSWSKPDKHSEDLLKHEQLHFDIAQLYALKLKQQLEEYHYTARFAEEVLAIFNDVKTRYHLAQRVCDEETNHSLNKQKQGEWENYVYQELLRATNNSNLTETAAKK